MTFGERTSHLTVEELIDVAEDPRVEASAPHLAVCERCRGQLTELRQAIASAHEADVPEPSPLFWAEFSRRISAAIATDRPASRRWFDWTRPRVFVPATAAVVAAIAVAVVLTPVERSPAPSAPATEAVDSPAGNLADAEGDSSLNLVADLTAGIDLTAAMDAGLTPRESAEHAVTHMDADELRALERLLKEAIARGGA